MAVFKCKMCGGALKIDEGVCVVTCEYCTTVQTLPRLNDDRIVNLYDRANHFRRNSDYDKAASIYEQILSEDPSDSEVYWSLVLCRYGIEYVEDPSTHTRVPTVNRAQYTSIYDDANYISAIENANAQQRVIYEKEANAINELQRTILDISQREEPFDVFICYKESDNNGRRTPDSVLAQELYYELMSEGYKVFFSRITLEDKLGVEYEPYIFAALNSAKVMVVLGTRPEHFSAVWVKNEWSRYLSLIKQGEKKTLIPAYKDMDPYDLPDEFSHLQAQDMSRLGFMQDLIRGIKKMVDVAEHKSTVINKTVINTQSSGITPLLKRVFMFLEDKDWQSADEYCEKVLDIDPECALAYLGKLMAQLKVNERDALKDQAEPFDSNSNYVKAVRFADDELKTILEGYIEFIVERNENARLERIYVNAIDAMNSANGSIDFDEIEKIFISISGYKDSDLLAKECQEKAEIVLREKEKKRKDAILDKAKEKMSFESVVDYEDTIKLLESISGWRDSEQLILECKNKIEEVIEKNKLIDKHEKKLTIITVIVASLAFLIFLFVIEFIIPNHTYNQATELMNEGKFTEAISVFEELNGYKDSFDRINECNALIKENKYQNAISLMNQEKYHEAIVIFNDLGDYKKAKESTTECEYCRLINYMDSGKYTAAIYGFEALGDYKDSKDNIKECKYRIAVGRMDCGNYSGAIEGFRELGDYKDSPDKYDECNIKKYGEKAWGVLKNLNVGGSYIFGSYEQDNNKRNGTEDIEWQVLDIVDTKILLLSKYGLDYKPYNDTDTFSIWDSCSLHNWLNSQFYNDAFSVDEKAMIPIVKDVYGSNSTQKMNNRNDNVFLLNSDQAKQYFSSELQRCCKPTIYAQQRGALTNYNGNCTWWLRSSGSGSGDRIEELIETFGGFVNETGNVEVIRLDYDKDSCYAVRPAIWIDLSLMK